MSPMPPRPRQRIKRYDPPSRVPGGSSTTGDFATGKGAFASGFGSVVETCIGAPYPSQVPCHLAAWRKTLPDGQIGADRSPARNGVSRLGLEPGRYRNVPGFLENRSKTAAMASVPLIHSNGCLPSPL